MQGFRLCLFLLFSSSALRRLCSRKKYIDILRESIQLSTGSYKVLKISEWSMGKRNEQPASSQVWCVALKCGMSQNNSSARIFEVSNLNLGYFSTRSVFINKKVNQVFLWNKLLKLYVLDTKLPKLSRQQTRICL